MKCPVDDETLLMTMRDGVEIDYCPKCRGVWLDRGELDKIIEKTVSEATPPVTLSQPLRDEQAGFGQPIRDPRDARPDSGRYDDRRDARGDDRRDDRDDRRDDHDRHGRGYGARRDARGRYDDDDDHRYRRKRKRKDSFLSELFDF